MPSGLKHVYVLLKSDQRLLAYSAIKLFFIKNSVTMIFSPHFQQDMEINAEELRNVLNNVVKKRELEHVFY